MIEQFCIFTALLKLFSGSNDRDGYLRDLEQQMAEQKARRGNEAKKDWWEKNPEPPFQVNQPQRPHPSMVRLTVLLKNFFIFKFDVVDKLRWEQLEKSETKSAKISFLMLTTQDKHNLCCQKVARL